MRWHFYVLGSLVLINTRTLIEISGVLRTIAEADG